MPNLYQLTDDIMALDQLLSESGGDVSEGTQGEVLEQWIKEFDWKMGEKIDAYASLIRNWQADIDACKTERARLAERERIIANRIDRLKLMAKQAMDMMGTRKMEGQKFTIALAKNGGEQPIELKVNPTDLPERFVRLKMEAAMDKIREALESGDSEAEKFAELKERGESVRIK